MLDSPIRQGAGVANIISSINGINILSVYPPKLSFNDTQHTAKTYSLAITSHQDSDLTVNLSHQSSAIVAGYNVTKPSQLEPIEPINFLATTQQSDYAHIHFSSKKLVIKAGQTVNVFLNVTPPTTINHLHTLYGGYINVRSKGCTARIPYIGMSGNMHDLTILDRTLDDTEDGSYPFPSIGNPNNTVLRSNETGHYVLNQTFPSVLARLFTGTSIAQIQVLDAFNHTVGDVPLQTVSELISPNPRAWVVRNLERTANGAIGFFLSASQCNHIWPK
jgi:hypothetical protein